MSAKTKQINSVVEYRELVAARRAKTTKVRSKPQAQEWSELGVSAAQAATQFARSKLKKK